jgi:pimeloyl-ACP methyl ester carboxylesterase
MAEPGTVTIALVHGAFAESYSNWKPVLELLLAEGYKVVAAPNPLRGVSSDAAYVSSMLNTIDGPIVLVGHSYGGAVITNAANGNQSVKALVYVAAGKPSRLGSSSERATTAFPLACWHLWPNAPDRRRPSQLKVPHTPSCCRMLTPLWS